MVRLALLLFVLALVLAVIALISCISAERGQVRGLPRWAWILVILLLPLAGPALYLIGGRPEHSRPAAGGVWRQVTGSGETPRPRRAVAPDDDPEFLRKLDHKGRDGDDDLLRRWEEDLRKREKDLRKKEDTPPADG